MTIYDDQGNRGDRHVAVLVLEAFIGPRPSPVHECNHDNGIKSDNHLSNLEWSTKSENVAHAYRTGLKQPNMGKRKLKPEEVVIIRYLKGKVKRHVIANQFGVDGSTIGRIWRGDTWK